MMLLFAALAGGGATYAQTGNTLLDTNFEDWKPTIGTDQANGTYTVPNATLVIHAMRFNNSSSPTAGTTITYPNYFRFGSAGNISGNYLEITPTGNFVNGGRVTLVITNNNNASNNVTLAVADPNDWSHPIAEFDQIGKTITIVTFDLPTSWNGQRTLRFYRKDVTTFLYAVKIETNSTEATTPQITTFVVAGASAYIDQDAGTITAELPSGTSLSSLTPDVGINAGDHYSPTGAQNFSNGAVTYTVYNQDESESKTYSVTLTVASGLSNDATLSDLTYNGVTIDGFLPTTTDYTIKVPCGGSAPIASDFSATANNASASLGNFAVSADTIPCEVTITVTAQNGSTKTYTIYFEFEPLSKEWNFSTLNNIPSSYPATIDGLYLHGGSSFSISSGNGSADGYTFTKRLSLGGAASPSGYTPTTRYVKFDVSGKARITVYGSSTSSDTRILNITDGTSSLGTLATNATVTKSVINHTGGAATIYMYSAGNGFNIFLIKVEYPCQEITYTPPTRGTWGLVSPAITDAHYNDFTFGGTPFVNIRTLSSTGEQGIFRSIDSEGALAAVPSGTGFMYRVVGSASDGVTDLVKTFDNSRA
ncbi:MAG: DUF5018 domain-containing protein, partial [Prevotellaceae bacterium]|nr:DUF5018 domain-containing protein [Prevotellaceae bacterium]